jgi:hypothetical protein
MEKNYQAKYCQSQMNQQIHKDRHKKPIPSLTKIGEKDTTIKKCACMLNTKNLKFFFARLNPSLNAEE